MSALGAEALAKAALRRCRAALAAAGVLSLCLASGPSVQTQSPQRVVWRGMNTDISMGPTCQSQLVQTFEFVGEEVPGSDPKWLSRKVTWDYSKSCADEVIVLEDVGAASPRRVLRPWTGSCTNKGDADLNTVPDPSVRSQCEESPRLGYMRRDTYPALGWTGPRPDEDMRNGCSYNTRSRQMDGQGNVRLITYSITVSRGEVDAVLEVDRADYDKFVPKPGESLTFTARSSRPAQFRFELEPEGTSRFPGYATNAYVDDMFYLKHPQVAHLRDKYTDFDPDVIFDTTQFPASQWSRAEFQVVESAEPNTSAAVTVTTMDYGAVGRLRAFVKSGDCGGGSWQPIPVRLGNETRESFNIPLDEDDNLMADALKDYHFLGSGADEDAEPKGNGTAGDGLTAFEEYRGFMIRGAECGESATALREVGVTPAEIPGATQMHVRTPPHRKNLFVHADDPLLATFVGHFAWASDLSALAICESGYASNNVRIVNYTLHELLGSRIWRGHTVLLEEPQHGIWLKRVDDTSVPGLQGLAVAIAPDAMGPPKLITAVEIVKPIFNPACEHSCAPGAQDLSITVRHELGHAVGVPHHGDDVVDWRTVSGRLDINPKLSPRQRAGGPPDFAREVAESDIPEALLVDSGPLCTKDDDHAAFLDEALTKFAGCLAANIIRRGQQHSGDVLCPMRYPNGDRYEPPGGVVRYLWSGIVHDPTIHRGSSGATYVHSINPVRVDGWGGRVLTYQNEDDNLHPPLGRLCVRTTGTGINALRGDLSHAGDNGRQKPCSEFVVVKDGAAPGR